jgi:hypothetical protein
MSQSQPPFIRLCSVEEVPEGTFKCFLIEAKEILLPKFESQYYAGRTPLCGPWKIERLYVLSISASLAYNRTAGAPNLTVSLGTQVGGVEDGFVFV